MEAFDRSIDVHVSRIRAVIEDDPKNPRRVLTVRGAGYVFAKRRTQDDAEPAKSLYLRIYLTVVARCAVRARWPAGSPSATSRPSAGTSRPWPRARRRLGRADPDARCRRPTAPHDEQRAGAARLGAAPAPAARARRCATAARIAASRVLLRRRQQEAGRRRAARHARRLDDGRTLWLRRLGMRRHARMRAGSPRRPTTRPGRVAAAAGAARTAVDARRRPGRVAAWCCSWPWPPAPTRSCAA